MILKCIRWLCRKWCKTSRGKWHIEKRTLPLRGDFVPVCMPHAIWKAIESKNHTPPKDGVVCKACAKLVEEGLH